MRKLWILLALCLAGCTALNRSGETGDAESEFKARHYAIYIDRFGNIKQREEVTPGDPKEALAKQADRERRYVDEIIGNFIAKRKINPNLKFTLFVHGGLNTFDNAWGRANLFSQTMLDEGRYPVFVGWNSGPFTNYFDHLFRIRKGERRPVLGPLSMPFVLIEDAFRSIAHIPEAWYMSVTGPVTVMKRVNADAEEEFQRRMDRLQKRNFNVISKPPFVGVGATYVTILNPAKLVTAPFVDGLGAGSWDSMLRRTDLVLSKALAFEGEISEDTPDNFADTAVTTLLKRIETLATDPAHVGEQAVHIDLIGHSMGSIVINNILARHPALKVDNVVFMGAAARIKDVENGVVPWLRRENNGARFFNLSLDPYRELGENTYYDFFPRGSLLHWIDNIFGEVNSFKDRTAGGWWNIIRTAEDVFPESVRSRVYLTRFPIGGEEQGPQTHGEFDDYYFWRESYWRAEPGQRKFRRESAASVQ